MAAFRCFRDNEAGRMNGHEIPDKVSKLSVVNMAAVVLYYRYLCLAVSGRNIINRENLRNDIFGI